MPDYMLDTNIFNHILDGGITIDELPTDGQFKVTHIQDDELSNTKAEDRKAKLLKVFDHTIDIRVLTESTVLGTSKLGQSKLGNNNIMPTESAVWDVSRYGMAKYTSEDNLYRPIKEILDKLNKNKPNNIQDALIAETSIKNGLTLITSDEDLCETAKKFGGDVIFFERKKKRS